MTTEQPDAWTEYLDTLHKLDAVRREAAAEAAAEAEAVAQARSELPIVQTRLGIQAGRLLEAALNVGAPPPTLTPGPAEQQTAEQAAAGGPAAILAALGQARSTVDVADAAIVRIGEREAPQAIRNLVAYGPAGFVAMVIQIGFTLLVDPRTKILYAFFCGFTMAAMLWAAAWLLLGMIYPGKDKTARFGAAICALPVALVFLAYALL
jgi:hypothetical protein